jgi:adenylate kinase family enzyme
MRVHVFGASGSGTTTLGRALAGHQGIPFFDADDYYWAPAEMPFTVKRRIPERHALLLPELNAHESWVLSGSMVSWVEPVLPLFQAAIYVYCPSEERISRLWARERERYGDRIEPGGDRHQAALDFIEWAQGYDSGAFDGRSRMRHEAFISSLSIPVLRLSSLDSRESLLSQAVDWLEAMK